MSKFYGGKRHATVKGGRTGVGGDPLCGARGSDGGKTLCISAAEWNTTQPEFRCLRCVEKIKARAAISRALGQ